MYRGRGMVLIFFGLVIVFFPEFIYELQESFRSDAIGTLSKWFIITTRFSGAIFVLAGLAGLITTFIE